MMTDDGLTELFERAVQDLDPAVPAMVSRAERLGRRMRTRLRVWVALGSCLAVTALGAAALGVGTALAHPPGPRAEAGVTRGQAGSKPAGRGDQPGAPPSEDGQASATPWPSPQPSASAPTGASFQRLQARGYQMPIGQMLGVLRNLLPAGSSVSNVNPYSAQDAMLEVDYNDGQGAVDLILSIDPTAWYHGPPSCPNPPLANEGPRRPGALPVGCAMRTLPDGSVESDAVESNDTFGFYGYQIYDQRPDGITVYIQVANGTNHLRPHVDRARPPGSMAEWEAVVENPAWHLKPGWQSMLK